MGKNKAKSKKQGRNKAFLLFRTKNREEIRKWVGENIKIDPRGGQAKICGAYADLVGTQKAQMHIFSMVLQIFSMMH